MKINTDKKLNSVVDREFRKKFTEKELERMEFYVDLYGDVEHTCRCELDNVKYHLVINKVNGTCEWMVIK